MPLQQPFSKTLVTNPIAPSSNLDPMATHYDTLGGGGWMSVYSTSERDNIPESRRKWGMVVVTIRDGQVYMLRNPSMNSSGIPQGIVGTFSQESGYPEGWGGSGLTDNTNWVLFNFNTSSGATGATGATGPAGSAGPQGPAGPQGASGPANLPTLTGGVLYVETAPGTAGATAAFLWSGTGLSIGGNTFAAAPLHIRTASAGETAIRVDGTEGNPTFLLKGDGSIYTSSVNSYATNQPLLNFGTLAGYNAVNQSNVLVGGNQTYYGNFTSEYAVRFNNKLYGSNASGGLLNLYEFVGKAVPGPGSTAQVNGLNIAIEMGIRLGLTGNGTTIVSATGDVSDVRLGMLVQAAGLPTGLTVSATGSGTLTLSATAPTGQYFAELGYPGTRSIFKVRSATNLSTSSASGGALGFRAGYRIFDLSDSVLGVEIGSVGYTGILGFGQTGYAIPANASHYFNMGLANLPGNTARPAFSTFVVGYGNTFSSTSTVFGSNNRTTNDIDDENQMSYVFGNSNEVGPGSWVFGKFSKVGSNAIVFSPSNFGTNIYDTNAQFTVTTTSYPYTGTFLDLTDGTATGTPTSFGYMTFAPTLYSTFGRTGGFGQVAGLTLTSRNVPHYWGANFAVCYALSSYTAGSNTVGGAYIVPGNTATLVANTLANAGTVDWLNGSTGFPSYGTGSGILPGSIIAIGQGDAVGATASYQYRRVVTVSATALTLNQGIAGPLTGGYTTGGGGGTGQLLSIFGPLEFYRVRDLGGRTLYSINGHGSVVIGPVTGTTNHHSRGSGWLNIAPIDQYSWTFDSDIVGVGGPVKPQIVFSKPISGSGPAVDVTGGSPGGALREGSMWYNGKGLKFFNGTTGMNLLLSGGAVNPPATAAASAPTQYIGGASVFLGAPTSWMLVQDENQNYFKLPLYS